MAEPDADELSPTNKDPAEGSDADDRPDAPLPGDAASSHLGAKGDPAEGKRED